MPEVHAKLSPSAAERWMACPGSVALSQGMPNRTSANAEEGTRAHTMAEAILKHDPSIYTDEYGEWDHDMEKHVRVYTNHVEDLYKNITDGSKWIEQKIAVTDDLWGTADAIVWDEQTKTLHVVDLKYGSGKVVEVRGNMQLRIYALAALLSMKLKARTVVATIVQPRAFHEDGAIRSKEFDSMDLMEFHGEVMEGVAKVHEANAAFEGDAFEGFLHPNANACRWCLGAVKCPKVKALANETAKQTFAPAEAYNLAELSETLSNLDIIEAWCKNVREFAYAEAEAGHDIPGWKLVEKRATRKIKPDFQTDPAPLAKALGVLPVELFKTPDLLPVSEIEALAPGKNKKEREAFLEPYVVKESSGHALVPESDKRPAVKLDAKAVFAQAEP